MAPSAEPPPSQLLGVGYTVLRKTERGVALRSLHRARFLSLSEEAARAFDEAVTALAPGLHALHFAHKMAVRSLTTSRLAAITSVQIAPSPLGREGTGPVAKPAPPCVYDRYRASDVLTLFMAVLEGETTIAEADCAAVIAWDGATLVLPPAATPRVASVAETHLASRFPHRRRPIAPLGREALAFVNAAGLALLPREPGRGVFPDELRRALAAALRDED